QEMVSAMQEQGLAVTFEQGPGDHNWIFWDQWIQRALVWLMEEK
ncbi:MAG: esterase family protein, partial [Enterococcus faecium]